MRKSARDDTAMVMAFSGFGCVGKEKMGMQPLLPEEASVTRQQQKPRGA